jgi:VWFA-related protein
MLGIMVRSLTSLIVFAAVGIGIATVVPTAQQVLPAQDTPITDAPPVTFRAEVNFVEIDAFVTDAQGNPVTDLVSDDFEIFEDGEPQTIDAFTHVNIPIARAERPLFAARPIEPDVQSNTEVEGRVYVFVLDAHHIDPTRTLRVKTALRQFVEENMGINDVAAVVIMGGRSDDGQDFTNNPRLLLASIDKFFGRKLRSPTSTITQEFNRPAVQALLDSGNADFIQDPLEFERTMRARQSMDMIRDLAEFMEGVRGRRKTMILVSEGLIFNIYDPFSNSSSIVLDESRDAIAAATRANVSIYAIDPRGLFAAEDLILAGNSPGADTLRLGVDLSSADENVSPMDLRIGLQSLGDEFRISQQGLRALAERTGGFAAVNRNVFDDVFDRIVRENSAYYVLGYYSTNESRDGRYREIEVRVRRPGLEVRFRDGYIAARGRAPQSDEAAPDETLREVAVRDALTSPLAVTGFPLSVFAAAYKGVAPNAMVPVTLEFDASGLNFVEQDGAYTTALTVTLVVSDGDGDSIASNQHELSLALRSETLARVQEHGFRVVSELALPPGQHRVRVVVADETGRAGSVGYDLDVLDFGSEAFSISGIALTSASVGESVTVLAHDPLGQLLPGAPTATREFSRGDVLSFYAEIYENTPDVPAHSIDLTTMVRAENGTVMFRSSEVRSSTELEGGQGGYGYAGEVPLDFEPGLYVLRVEGRSRLSGRFGGEARDILIRVTP